ncbi:MAG TPA: 1,4-dihydroxy-2-naphthoate octaprenyltransferase [Thermomicrobiales bacterium]|jgi:1,4-dihydroxy-2-naphthoate octaprenyltransferase
MRSRLAERLLSLLSPLLLLALWEIAARIGWLNRQFFPAPSSIVGTFGILWDRGTIGEALGATTQRVLLGFVWGTVPAILLGLVLGLSRPLRVALLPIANILYSLPKIAILPLVLLVLGIGETSKIVVTAISVFFLILLNTVAGVQGIDRLLFDVARDFGASRWQAYRTVALPGALPLILAGCKLGLGFALIVVVGTEFVASGAHSGVGVLIWESWQVLNIEAMYVGLILTAALGWALNLAMDESEVALLPWRAERAGGVGRVRPERRLAGVPVRVWWRATRPFSFTATIIPVTLGAVLAPTTTNWFARLALFAITLVGSLAVHAGANMINDYYDHRNGLDDEASLGPSKAIQQGLLSARQVLFGGLAAFALGATLGLILVALRGPAILVLGLICLPLAFFYTGWPFKLAYHGLGEILVAIFMGPVMILGSYYVQAREFALTPALISLPVAFLVAAIMHANNLRDIEPDRARGKVTVANILGPALAAWEYYLLVLGAYALVVALTLTRIASPTILLSILTLPLALSLVRRVAATREPLALNGVLRQTSALHLRFGALLIVGLLIPLLG